MPSRQFGDAAKTKCDYVTLCDYSFCWTSAEQLPSPFPTFHHHHCHSSIVKRISVEEMTIAVTLPFTCIQFQFLLILTLKKKTQAFFHKEFKWKWILSMFFCFFFLQQWVVYIFFLLISKFIQTFLKLCM